MSCIHEPHSRSRKIANQAMVKFILFWQLFTFKLNCKLSCISIFTDLDICPKKPNLAAALAFRHRFLGHNSALFDQFQEEDILMPRRPGSTSIAPTCFLGMSKKFDIFESKMGGADLLESMSTWAWGHCQKFDPWFYFFVNCHLQTS